MNPVQRLLTTARRAVATVRGPAVETAGADQPLIINAMLPYEGARNAPERSWLPGFVQDASQDINAYTRFELLRKARYFEKNHALFQKILDLIETNVIGTGLIPTPSTTDENFNRAAAAWWATWCKFCDLTSRQHFHTLQAIIARAQACDGEIFTYLTYGDSGRPRIQLIEAHRVVSAKVPGYIAEGYIDAGGILLDPRGRPAFYIVGQNGDALGKTPTTVAVIPADQMVHTFEPSRSGQYRGTTIFHSTLHTLHDLDDLQYYEMQAAKANGSRANVVKNESGEAPADSGPIGRKKLATPTDDPAIRSAYYTKQFGGQTVYLFRGDTLEQTKNDRPSQDMRDFWEYLTDTVCRGVGISSAAVNDYKGNWGGAALRGAVISDNRFYEVRTENLTASFQRIYEFALRWAIQNNDILDEKGIPVRAPANWFATTWQPPRRASVDIGRESSAMLNELRAGLRTFRDLAGEVGLDWRDLIRQRIAEQKFITDTARKMGVPPELVLPMLSIAPAPTMLPKPPAAATPPADPSAPSTHPDQSDPAPQPVAAT